jgi:hypothetical protein
MLREAELAPGEVVRVRACLLALCLHLSRAATGGIHAA